MASTVFLASQPPGELVVNALKCTRHPMLKRDCCGADASGSFNRDDFGLIAGKEYGFMMNVNLRIQIEAIVAAVPWLSTGFIK